MNALDMLREDASNQRGDPVVTVDAKALARVLAVAEAAVALWTHENDTSNRWNSETHIQRWDAKRDSLREAHHAAVSALTEEVFNG